MASPFYTSQETAAHHKALAITRRQIYEPVRNSQGLFLYFKPLSSTADEPTGAAALAAIQDICSKPYPQPDAYCIRLEAYLKTPLALASNSAIAKALSRIHKKRSKRGGKRINRVRIQPDT
jgi:hypothetical protein